MPIRGSELVQRLQTMVKVSTRERHRAISEQFGAAITQDLSRFGIEHLANEAFDFFRKWRRDELSMKKLEDAHSEGLVNSESQWVIDREARDSWLRIPLVQLEELFESRRPAFEFYVSEFNIIKSKATHVTAVFRPFQERYLSEWRSYLDSYPADKVMMLRDRLNFEQIGDKVELHIWADSVYELFKLAAVYNPDYEHKSLSPDGARNQKRLPQGMISSTSERIYGQQWRLWLRENEDEISKFLSQLQEESVDPALIATDHLAAVDLDQDVPMGAQIKKSGSSNGISIEVTVSGSPELNALQNWVNGEYSEEALERWLTLLQSAWSLDGELVHVALKFQSESNSSEMTLRPVEISKVTSSVSKVIELLPQISS